MALSRNTVRITNSEVDAYTTPDIAVEALLSVEKFEGKGWEPACGTGNIAKYFPGIMRSDIRTGTDFLKVNRPNVDFIVTNPPYVKALEFMERALTVVKARKVAMLLRLQILEGQRRLAFFRRCPPSRVWVFSYRVGCYLESHPMAGRNSPSAVAYCWVVWDLNQQDERGRRGERQYTELGWL